MIDSGDNINMSGTLSSATVDEKISKLFDYHPPTSLQVEQMKTIREYAKVLAYVIDITVPSGSDKSAAIRLLRQCVQISNAAIVLDGLNY